MTLSLGLEADHASAIDMEQVAARRLLPIAADAGDAYLTQSLQKKGLGPNWVPSFP